MIANRLLLDFLPALEAGTGSLDIRINWAIPFKHARILSCLMLHYLYSTLDLTFQDRIIEKLGSTYVDKVFEIFSRVILKLDSSPVGAKKLFSPFQSILEKFDAYSMIEYDSSYKNVSFVTHSIFTEHRHHLTSSSLYYRPLQYNWEQRFGTTWLWPHHVEWRSRCSYQYFPEWSGKLISSIQIVCYWLIWISPKKKEKNIFKNICLHIWLLICVAVSL